MSHCDEIVILDKGMHEEGKAKPGHLVVVLDQLKDPQYERKGADLIVEKTVPLKEALLGFTEEYVLPTGNVVPITLAPGEIMRHKDKRLCVPGLGMPTRISALRRGNLVFDFTIEYPNAEWITKHEGFIARSLPPKVDTPKATIKASRGQTRLSPHFLVPCKEDVVPEEGPGCAVQ